MHDFHGTDKMKIENTFPLLNDNINCKYAQSTKQGIKNKSKQNKNDTELIDSHVPSKYKIERAYPLSQALTF